jgi:hypothetical protein
MAQADPWKTLNLSPTKDQHAIEQAWRRLASQHHPDRGGDVELFRQARESYELALKLSSSVIPIVKVGPKVQISVSLGRSRVLAACELTVRWINAQDKEQFCALEIPQWQDGWGSSRILTLKDPSSKSTLHFNVQLHDDDLILINNQLVWKPTVELVPILKSRKLTATLNSCEYSVDIDDHGNGLLRSQGYLTRQGEKSNILVQPRYVWPKVHGNYT